MLTEADTQFGVTSKTFRFQDYSGYIADDWKVSRKLSLNLGLRYELFMWPTEKDGRIGNFDFSNFRAMLHADGRYQRSLRQSSARFPCAGQCSDRPGLANVDAAIDATAKAGNNHTLNGQDTNNFAPRIGFAYSPLESNRLVVRGGFGFFYDRPSASFINTVFSNYPFLREIEITVPSGNVPYRQRLWRSADDPAAQQLAAFSRDARAGSGRHLCDPRQHRRDSRRPGQRYHAAGKHCRDV